MISIGKFLFHNNTVPFIGLSLSQEQVAEKVYLFFTEENVIDVTEYHWIVCSEPFVVAVWLSRGREPQNLSVIKLIITLHNKTVGVISLTVLDKVNDQAGYLLLARVTHSASRHLNFLRRSILIRYLEYINSKENLEMITNFCVAYSYPRKVVLVTVSDDKYFNIFPMDFQGFLTESNQYILGLRKTNVAIHRIEQSRKILVCDPPASTRDILYTLGKHHSEAPISKNSLPFGFYPSEKLRMPVADFAVNYYELKLRQSKTLGSHVLLVCEVIHRQRAHEQAQHLYHVHTIHALHKQRVS
jgi:flavin reductase (DIM6/NTAB) family NADH-FMN oxidoreductase RutF